MVSYSVKGSVEGSDEEIQDETPFFPSFFFSPFGTKRLYFCGETKRDGRLFIYNEDAMPALRV